MGKISLEEMLENKIEKKESIEKIKTFQKKFGYDFTDAFKENDDTGELELGASYERLTDFVLTKLHGNFEFTIPKETFMEKVFNKFTKEGKEYSEAHKDDYRKDENLHIQLKVVPGYDIYRTGLGPDNQIALLEPAVQGIDVSCQIPFEKGFFDPLLSRYEDQYERHLVGKYVEKLKALEIGSRDRWVEKNGDKFKSIDDAKEYYQRNWEILTDVDYYKENMVRTDAGGKIQKNQSNVIYEEYTKPNGEKYKDVVYSKPRAFLLVNGKEVELLSKEGLETLNRINTYEKTPGHEFKSVKVPAKMKELAKDQGGAVKRHVTSKVIEAPLTTRQADSLIALIFRQAQRTVDRPIGR